MHIPERSWSTTSANPTEEREFLARFWLACPSDQLESSWHGPIGDLTIRLVSSLDQGVSFTPYEIAFRSQLGDWFNSNGLTDPLALQLMIANFIYSPPGLLQINNIDKYFPAWFVRAYQTLYTSGNPALSTKTTPTPDQRKPTPGSLPLPDFGAFPSDLNSLSTNRIHLNRILGLSNLYYIDPDDKEIANELLDVRHSLIQLISSTPESELERYWTGELGERYWALVRSGVQSEPRTSSDETFFSAATRYLTPSLGGPGVGAPGSLNHLLIAMLYYLPGTMSIDAPEQKLPRWLLEPYLHIFTKANS